MTPASADADASVPRRERTCQVEVQLRPDRPIELHARDKRTGEILASERLPALGQYGMMTYMHEGQQSSSRS